MPDTRNGTTPLAKLAVDRKELVDALRILTRSLKVAKAGEAIIRFVDGDLVIQIGGAKVSARASGRWPGEARLPGAYLLAAAKLLPAGDPLPIRVEAEQFYIADSSIHCVWQRSGAAKIEIPIEATLPMLLQIARDAPARGTRSLWHCERAGCCVRGGERTHHESRPDTRTAGCFEERSRALRAYVRTENMNWPPLLVHPEENHGR